MDDEQISYMGYLWVSADDGVVTIGIDEEAAADLSEDIILNLPEEDDIILPGKMCGDIESANGTLNLYSPVGGTVLEINEAILDNPSLIVEDPHDEGWLFRVEADDIEKIDKLRDKPTSNLDDFDDDDEEDDEIEPIIDGEDGQ